MGDRRGEDDVVLAHHGLSVVALEVGVALLHHPGVGIGRVRHEGVLGGGLGLGGHVALLPTDRSLRPSIELSNGMTPSYNQSLDS